MDTPEPVQQIMETRKNRVDIFLLSLQMENPHNTPILLYFTGRVSSVNFFITKREPIQTLTRKTCIVSLT